VSFAEMSFAEVKRPLALLFCFQLRWSQVAAPAKNRRSGDQEVERR